MMRSPVDKLESALTTLPETILVGVSGGVDSIALLHALVELGRKPIVLHFDHGWRKESGEDAKWLRDLAQKWSLKFIAAKMRVSTKGHREAEARAARYAFFSKSAARLGIRDLVLAHHADDQVEKSLPISDWRRC